MIDCRGNDVLVNPITCQCELYCTEIKCLHAKIPLELDPHCLWHFIYKFLIWVACNAPYCWLPFVCLQDQKVTVIAITVTSSLGRRRLFAQINSFIAVFILAGQLTLTVFFYLDKFLHTWSFLAAALWFLTTVLPCNSLSLHDKHSQKRFSPYAYFITLPFTHWEKCGSFWRRGQIKKMKIPLCN